MTEKEVGETEEVEGETGKEISCGTGRQSNIWRDRGGRYRDKGGIWSNKEGSWRDEQTGSVTGIEAGREANGEARR